MALLETDNRFADPDAAFRIVIEAHRGLDEERSRMLNARLVLVLANHIGDIDVLKQAVALAKKGLDAPAAAVM